MADRAAVSKLDAFCLVHKIRTPQLAEASDVSRQHVVRVRYGRADARLKFAKKIARGASIIVGRKVPVAELFDLDFDYPVSGSLRP
jgi:DNA-binding XRE family transcriptional regulator